MREKHGIRWQSSTPALAAWALARPRHQQASFNKGEALWFVPGFLVPVKRRCSPREHATA
jgi:hypothetical protein